MRIRTQPTTGKQRRRATAEGLAVRTALKAGCRRLNHNEVLQVRTTLKAGRIMRNHNETLKTRSRVTA